MIFGFREESTKVRGAARFRVMFGGGFGVGRRGRNRSGKVNRGSKASADGLIIMTRSRIWRRSVWRTDNVVRWTIIIHRDDGKTRSVD